MDRAGGERLGEAGDEHRSPADGIRWDLGAIYVSLDIARSDLPQLGRLAEAFERRHRGGVAQLAAAALSQALDEYCQVETIARRLGGYAYLRQAVDTEETASRDFANAVSSAVQEAVDHTRFFELELEALTPAALADRAADPELTRYRHHLELLAAHARHRLSEPEERAYAARQPAANTAWAELFSSTLATVVVPVDCGDGVTDLTVDGALNLLFHGERELRQRALDAVYRALEPRADVLARCYDSIVADRLVSDRIFGYATPMEQANADNDLGESVVSALIESVEANYPLAQRWFRAKAARLGLPQLTLADQYAPLGSDMQLSFAQGCDLMRISVEGFSPELWQLVSAAIEEHRIDAEPRAGKRGGGFCSPVALDAPTYILLNYSGGLSQVRTLVHEAGHLIHMTLAKKRQTALTYETGMAMAEIASTFNEMLLFDHQMATETDLGVRNAIVASRIESSFNTVFRQTTMARYEQAAYGLRQQQQSLTAERLSAVWMECNRRYYGDSVELHPGYRLGWSYIPHFIVTRFYTYSYSFAHLASLALYARYREQGHDFVAGYIEFLAAGGSLSPARLLADMGIDITRPDWVDIGFAEMERMVALAEIA